MNNRARFHEAMGLGTPDRAPYFEEGIRDEVVEAWRKQGLPEDADLSKMFPSDPREEIMVDVDPLPPLKKQPMTMKDLDGFRKRLDPDDPARLPGDWDERVESWKNGDVVRMLRVHRGFFLTMGIRDWKRFMEVMDLLFDDPDLVKRCMKIQGEFAAGLAERVLKDIDVDAAIFSEPIGGNDQSLISPKMYEEFVLPSYKPLLDVLRRARVDVVIFRTYANARVLIPSILKWGFNCLWACEVNIEAMDYTDLRREFGRDLRLIGGVDVDVLGRDKEAIRREVEEKAPALIRDGAYAPLADGRVRENVPYENYVYYRQLMDGVIRG
ncbi:MAG: hypothetical protein GY859_30090 [Desulfobacterales bacterium]|nr:hypothetical protein [Desulfobacterales bacterium]